jgi:hypothetical protein
MSDRSTDSILNALKSIFKKRKSLESDDEAVFVSKPVLKYRNERPLITHSLMNKGIIVSALLTGLSKHSVIG